MVELSKLVTQLVVTHHAVLPFVIENFRKQRNRKKREITQESFGEVGLKSGIEGCGRHRWVEEVQLPPQQGPRNCRVFCGCPPGRRLWVGYVFQNEESGMNDSQRTIEDSPLLYCLHLSTRDRWAHISPLVCLKCYLPVTVLPSPGKTECCLLMPSFFPFITFFFFCSKIYTT